MNARERILTIRLLEKVEAHPAYAKALGIEVVSIPTPNSPRILPEHTAGKSTS